MLLIGSRLIRLRLQFLARHLVFEFRHPARQLLIGLQRLLQSPGGGTRPLLPAVRLQLLRLTFRQLLFLGFGLLLLLGLLIFLFSALI